MTLKSIFYAGLIATTGLVVSQASVQAASLTHMKSVLPFSQAHSHTPNVIFVHDPSYAEYRAAHRRNHRRQHNYSYTRNRHAHKHHYKPKRYPRTCTVMQYLPEGDETGLTMPPWKRVPC